MTKLFKPRGLAALCVAVLLACGADTQGQELFTYVGGMSGYSGQAGVQKALADPAKTI